MSSGFFRREDSMDIVFDDSSSDEDCDFEKRFRDSIDRLCFELLQRGFSFEDDESEYSFTYDEESTSSTNSWPYDSESDLNSTLTV